MPRARLLVPTARGPAGPTTTGCGCPAQTYLGHVTPPSFVGHRARQANRADGHEGGWRSPHLREERLVHRVEDLGEVHAAPGQRTDRRSHDAGDRGGLRTSSADVSDHCEQARGRLEHVVEVAADLVRPAGRPIAGREAHPLDVGKLEREQGRLQQPRRPVALLEQRGPPQRLRRLSGDRLECRDLDLTQAPDARVAHAEPAEHLALGEEGQAHEGPVLHRLAGQRRVPGITRRPVLDDDRPPLADGLRQRQRRVERERAPAIRQLVGVARLGGDREAIGLRVHDRDQASVRAHHLERVPHDHVEHLIDGGRLGEAVGEPLEHPLAHQRRVFDLVGRNRVHDRRGACGELRDEGDVVFVVPP